MNPEFKKKRRAAKAKALIDLHPKDRGAGFVDAAENPDCRKAFAAAVVGCNEECGECANSSGASSRGGSHCPSHHRPRVHDFAV